MPAHCCTFGGMLNTREAAAFLNVHPRTVHRYVAAGLLRPYRVGRALRFERAVLLRFLTRDAGEVVA